jgi:hypothetical protein
MTLRPLLTAVVASACACAAQATTTTLAADASWYLFDVTPDLAADSGLGWIDITDGSALSFSFDVAAGTKAVLTVVDGGFSGDVFSVRSNGAALANTSTASNSYPNSIGLDFDAALAQPNFSRGSYVFGAGSYSVSGALATSALDDLGAPINATVGAVQLQVSAVPEASTLSSLLAGLGLIGFLLRRRAQ